MHVCGLLVLDPATMPGGYDFNQVRDDLRRRIGRNPGFRRKLHDHPLNLDHPVWVDDPAFDTEDHVLPEWIGRARSGRAMPAPFTVPRTSFNGTITGHRTVA